jgi:hypothetical protein
MCLPAIAIVGASKCTAVVPSFLGTSLPRSGPAWGGRRTDLSELPSPTLLLQHWRLGHRPLPLAHGELMRAHGALHGHPEGEAHFLCSQGHMFPDIVILNKFFMLFSIMNS